MGNVVNVRDDGTAQLVRASQLNWNRALRVSAQAEARQSSSSLLLLINLLIVLINRPNSRPNTLRGIQIILMVTPLKIK